MTMATDRTAAGIAAEMPKDSSVRRLRERLGAETRCEVKFDAGSRAVYATDASLYQIAPVGAAIPRTVRDAELAVRIAGEEGVPIVARGGATSLSGQTIGHALILDVSKYLTGIGVVDRSSMTVPVQPGVVLDRLQSHLHPLGLMFAPDVSTSDRATIGGMIGNNSAGARSLKYGKTVDHVRSLDVVLADGTTARLGPQTPDALEELCRGEDRIARLHRDVRDTVLRHADAIREKYPKILRRVSGYNLDELLSGYLPVQPPARQGPADPWMFNLARLVTGSEGTLALVTGAVLNLVPAPPAQGLVIVSFDTIPHALEHLEAMIATGPASVEMVDKTILDLAARNAEYARYVTFVSGRPSAVLAAQFHAGSADELRDRVEHLVKICENLPGVLGIRTSLTSSAKDDFWKIRKAGLSLLMGMVGDAKPVAFVEDTAVDPRLLPAFYAAFESILKKYDVIGSCYGHADVGCLHIRPILNTKDPADVEKLRGIASDVSDLVVAYGGAMSGEHGDGLARSLWNEKLFGPELYRAFQDVKAAFDPKNLMNPGKVVAAHDLGADLRLGPSYQAREPQETLLDFSAQGGFARAVEMCSGVGACRKTEGGTMCPSYMITRDEEHSTRGRANLLRSVMNGDLPARNLSHPALHEALDLCLQCKACKTECPSNVDMSKLKAEFLYQYYRDHSVPINARLMGRLHQLYPIAAKFARMSNWFARQPLTRFLMEKVLKIDRRRIMPAFAQVSFREWFDGRTPVLGSRGRVVLLDDCFLTYNQPDVGKAAVKVLEAAGYTVIRADLPCCGRPAISKGLLAEARTLAAENVMRLLPYVRAGVPIVGCEPSCLLTLTEEYRDFRLGPDADLVAEASFLIEEFAADVQRTPDLALEGFDAAQDVLLHGHCQQKALRGITATVQMLSRIPNAVVKPIDSGCCGMAGSFGYEHGHYDLSLALANRVLLPTRAQNPQALLTAPGFSCRSQVKDLTGETPLHPIELIAKRLSVASAIPE